MNFHIPLSTFSEWFWPQAAAHLWQTTLFTALAWAAAQSLRHAGATTRHAVWLIASWRLALPAGLLAWAGVQAGGLLPSPAWQAVAGIAPLAGRLSPSANAAPPQAHIAHHEIYCVMTLVWLAGIVTCLLRWRRQLRTGGSVHREPNQFEQEAFQAAEEGTGLHERVRLVISAGPTEPVLRGILRPRIILPEGLSGVLSPQELVAVLSHELIHASRHDNLTAALHRAIACVWWFHPAAWWIERRMAEERECACDETVVRRGAAREDYTSALLMTCRFSAGCETAGVSGVTGGTNMKERIERIIHAPARPAARRALALVAAVIVAAVWPAIGGFLVNAGQPDAGKLLPGIEWVRIENSMGQPLYDSSKAGPAAAPDAFLARSWPAPSGLTVPYRKWLDEDVTYLITDAERAGFLRLPSDSHREQFIEQFWKRRDPSPGTAANEFKEEHYRRIRYANERFPDDGPGWRSTRGRVYIKLGPPDEIESHPRDRYEAWKYASWDNLPQSLFVRFALPE
jgi:GWxTD domain-containing protein